MPLNGVRLFPHQDKIAAAAFESYQYRGATIWRLDRWWAGKQEGSRKHYFGESREIVERQIDGTEGHPG